MSSYNIQKFGLAIDWETSGFSYPDYAKDHQGISFGAIIFDISTLETVEELYREVKFDATKYQWSMRAQEIHGITQAHLLQNGVSQAEAAQDLLNLILKYIGNGDVTLLGHRVYFDKAFTQQLTESVGIELSYHPTVIDSSSIGTLFLEQSRSEEIFQSLGLPARGKHNAMEDIRMTLESVRILKKFFLDGVAANLN